MKQSTKLLSVLLAVILLFGVVSVGANAVLVNNEIEYDSVDNAV